MFMAGSLIIPSQPQPHCLPLHEPCCISFPLQESERVRKKNDDGGANKWCSVGSMQSRAGRYDQARTYREETHGQIIQPKVTQGHLASLPENISVTAQWHHSKHLQRSHMTRDMHVCDIKHIAKGPGYENGLIHLFCTLRPVLHAIPPLQSFNPAAASL